MSECSEEPASKKPKKDMEKIAIFRSEGGSFQKYQSLLESNNFESFLVPSIDFEYKNLSELKEALKTPENYSGIIFTSPRSVTAVVKALSNEKLPSEWKNKQNYCVGASTWNEASVELDLNPAGKDSGSASKLSEMIINDFEKDSKPLLFPCSSIKSDVLPSRLKENGISLKIIDSYDTIPHPELENNLKTIIDDSKIRLLVFFSPSGVNSCKEILQKGQLTLKNKKIIAIGETTKQSIVQNGFECHGIASSPTPEGLLECLQTFKDS
ncbi:uroporphyrinogen-III synthase-like [Culicoides brevitarsis]|uniref:uroporphyrinogen-III synthase-like n=1 Tax=Culicoides brevitarsis TaxID=469753 RepID=UPI00307BD342